MPVAENENLGGKSVSLDNYYCNIKVSCVCIIA